MFLPPIIDPLEADCLMVGRIEDRFEGSDPKWAAGWNATTEALYLL